MLASESEETILAFNRHFLIDGKLPVAATNKLLVKQWVDECLSASILLDYIVPEFISLDITRGQWFVHFSGNQYVVRTGDVTAFSTSEENLSVLFAQAEHEYGKPSKVLIDRSASSVLGNYLEINDIEYSVVSNRFIWANAQKYIAYLNFKPELDSSNQLSSWDHVRKFIPALVLLLLSLIIYGFSVQTDLSSLKQLINNQKQQTTVLFKQHFPYVKRVVSPLIQARRLLKQERSNRQSIFSLLAILNEVAQTLSAKVSTIDYSNGFVSAVLEVSSFNEKDIVSSLESFNSSVSLQGSIETVSNGKDQFTIRIGAQ